MQEIMIHPAKSALADVATAVRKNRLAIAHGHTGSSHAMLFNQISHPLDKFFARARADLIQSIDEHQEFGQFLAITIVIFK
jgi:hypothetical protein